MNFRNGGQMYLLRSFVILHSQNIQLYKTILEFVSSGRKKRVNVEKAS
jgi:hypothetical protein